MEVKPLGILATVGMLVVSNLFMTFAWYWHLKLQKPGAPSWPLIAIIVVSWLIAFVEYIILVPANRLGAASGMNVAQLKITQEVITVCVFIPFMILFMGEKWRWDYLWAFLCVLGAVGNGAVALPVDQHDISAAFPPEAQHLQLIVGNIRMGFCPGLAAAEVRSKISTVIADVVAYKGHAGDEALTDKNFRGLQILDGFLGSLCHLLAIVGKIIQGILVVPIVDGRACVGMGDGNGNVILRHAGSFMDGAASTVHHRRLYRIEKIHGAEKHDRAFFIPHRNAGAGDPIQDQVALALEIVTVACQGAVDLRGHIHPSKAGV